MSVIAQIVDDIITQDEQTDFINVSINAYEHSQSDYESDDDADEDGDPCDPFDSIESVKPIEPVNEYYSDSHQNYLKTLSHQSSETLPFDELVRLIIVREEFKSTQLKTLARLRNELRKWDNFDEANLIDTFMDHKWEMNYRVFRDMIAKVMSPERLMKQLSQYDDFESFFENL